MKLSVFTTITNPEQRGDDYIDALRCYNDLADEVIVVNGGYAIDVKGLAWYTQQLEITSYWPSEFSWEFIGQQFQRGYERATGDWVIHADLDFLFHENNFSEIRNAINNNPNSPALSFWKYQFILPDRYNIKSRLVVAVNKGKFGNRIRFDSGGDLCQPSLDGKYIEPGTIPEARVPLYNYEKIIKTKEQIMSDQGRMERAYKRHFERYQMSKDGSDDDAFDCWVKMQTGRFNKPQKHIPLGEHPKYIQETIKNLKPENWGFSGLDNLPVNDYVTNV